MACSNEIFKTYMEQYDEDALEEIFERHDMDGNGFIDATELDGFIRDLCENKPLNAEEREDFKKMILESVDNNNDGKLDKNEIRNMLTQANFLNCLEKVGKRVCGVDFMKIWNHYDKNKNGILDGSELEGFIRDLLLKCSPGTQNDAHLPKKISSYKHALEKKYEGQVGRAAMFSLLNVETICPTFQGKCSKNFETEFSKFDKDNNGIIDEKELPALLSALFLDSDEEIPVEINDIIMTKLDKNNDKKIQKAELKEYLKIHDC